MPATTPFHLVQEGSKPVAYFKLVVKLCVLSFPQLYGYMYLAVFSPFSKENRTLRLSFASPDDEIILIGI